MSLLTEFFRAAAPRPDAPAVVEDDRSVPFRQLAQLVERIGAGLRQAGVTPGERVAIHLGNRVELVALYYACLGAGAVIVPLHRRLVAG